MKTLINTPAISLLSLLTLALATGCDSGSNSDSNGDSSSTKQSYKYQLIHNGCDTGQKEFSSKSDYCAALEDGAKNGYCAIDERADLYKRDCGGEFHESDPAAPEPEPVHSQPQPAPQPEPQPQPAPHPAPQPEGPKVVQDFAAAGIKVEVSNEHGINMPGDEPFSVRLERFWNNLEATEGEFLGRKSLFDTIIVSEYGNANPSLRYFTLSVDMSQDDLRAFARGLDRMQTFQAHYGVTLELGVIEYRPGFDGTADLNAKLGFLETNGQRVAGPVKLIKFDSSTMYSLYDRSLSLNYDKYQAEFADIARVLIPAQAAFQVLDALKITVSSTSLIFNKASDREAQTFAALTKALGQEKNSLSALVHAGALKEIEAGSDENNFYPSLQKLNMATTGAGYEAFHGVLAALAEQALFGKESGIEFDYSYQGLGAPFVAASGRLSPLLPAVRAKAKLVRKVEFSSKSVFEYSVLTVGTEDGAADLRKAVDSIK